MFQCRDQQIGAQRVPIGKLAFHKFIHGGHKLIVSWRVSLQLLDVICCESCFGSFGMIDVAILVSIFFEILSFNIGPCIPNVGIPLK